MPARRSDRIAAVLGATMLVQSAHATGLDFAPPVALIPDHGVIVVEAADMDLDGDLDIVVASLGGDVSILPNLQGAGFGPPQHHTAGSTHLEMIIADLNGDSVPDVALANFLGAGNVSVLLSERGGDLGAAVDYPAPGVPNPRAIASGDLDADGDRDLLVGDGILTTKAVLLNDGSGAFNQALPFNSGGTSIQMALGDLDADCVLDGVSVFSGIWLHRGNGDGTFAPAVSLLAAQSTAVAIADLDGDGDLDIAAALSSVGTNQAAVFLNAGDGASFDQAGYEIDTLARDIAVADLDGDGHADIATSHVSPENTVDVLLNQRDGTFIFGGAFSPGTYPQSLTLADFDGDGRCDIATANQFASPPEVGVLVNQTPLPLPADIDGDGTVGILDLLALLSGWGPCAACADCPADLDGDCSAGILDLLGLLAAWS